jgi:hypothetical protein
MKALRAAVLTVVTAIWLAGCAMTSVHYNWAYTPLHDVDSAAFQKPPHEVEYRQLDSFDAMAEAERDMYRKGYIMIGYSNMMSPQLEMVAASGARALGKKYGASVVLNTFCDHHYLATLWARPKHFVLGAYFTDELPEKARAALKLIQDTEHSLIVQTVVDDSPAFKAGLLPGDLLISLNGTTLQDVATMDKLLQQDAGSDVTIVIWSMEAGPPRPVTVALGAIR